MRSANTNVVFINKHDQTRVVIIPQDNSDDEGDDWVIFESKTTWKRRLQFARASLSQAHEPAKHARKRPLRMRGIAKKKGKTYSQGLSINDAKRTTLVCSSDIRRVYATRLSRPSS